MRVFMNSWLSGKSGAYVMKERILLWNLIMAFCFQIHISRSWNLSFIKKIRIRSMVRDFFLRTLVVRWDLRGLLRLRLLSRSSRIVRSVPAAEVLIWQIMLRMVLRRSLRFFLVQRVVRLSLSWLLPRLCFMQLVRLWKVLTGVKMRLLLLWSIHLPTLRFSITARRLAGSSVRFRLIRWQVVLIRMRTWR